MYWAVLSQSKHPAEAAEFVNFLLNDMNAVTPGESPVVTPNGGSGIEPQLQRYTQDVYFKETSPKAAAKALIKELQGEIDAAK